MATPNEILAFVKSHDWGQGAYIENDQIYGVLNRYTVDGVLYEDEIKLPLDLKQIRDWAGY